MSTVEEARSGGQRLINSAGSVAELRATSGRLVRNISGAPFQNSSPGGAIAADGTHLWAAGAYYDQSGGWVTELSGATGALVRVISG